MHSQVPILKKCLVSIHKVVEGCEKHRQAMPSLEMECFSILSNSIPLVTHNLEYENKNIGLPWE